MSIKEKRQNAISDLIANGTGSTQEEIRSRLEELKILASQATLSRDLRELGAVKVPLESGGYTYTFGGKEIIPNSLDSISHAMSEYMLGYEAIGNFLVIKSNSGTARDLCLVLDRQNWNEIAGTLAGDDTILVIARSVEDVEKVISKLKIATGRK